MPRPVIDGSANLAVIMPAYTRYGIFGLFFVAYDQLAVTNSQPMSRFVVWKEN